MRSTLIIAAAVLTAAGQAEAQATRTFVSGHGEDSNPCSLTAPCRSFAHALTQTNPGGEITVLDSAGYGAVTITKSVSIVNEDGVEAGITVTTATDAIDITVGASDVVNLRGLTLEGGGIGKNGINFTNLGALNIQSCVIRGFLGGIVFLPAGTAALNVSDTIVSNNSSIGAEAEPATGNSGAVTAAFNRVQAIGAPTGNGFLINGAGSIGTLDVTIANSAATNNGNGISAGSAARHAQPQIMVSNSVVSNNATGVADTFSSTIYLAKNTIAGNTTAFSTSPGAQLFSFGDNYIKGNGDDATSPPITLVATK